LRRDIRRKLGLEKFLGEIAFGEKGRKQEKREPRGRETADHQY